MTHTLHRVKGDTGKYDDYVVLIMPAKKINNQESYKKFKKYIELLKQYEPINLGAIGLGNMALNTIDEMQETVSDASPMIHAVYKDRETLISVLKALKEADYGYSVVVSGLLEDVDECAKKAGIQRHSVDLSLGIWGDKEKLPPQEVMEITTMCGHALISANLVLKMVDEIKKGKRTAKKAALEITKPCACGIFNTDKAERLLTELAEKL